MKKNKNQFIFFVLLVSLTSFSAYAKPTEMEYVALTFKEIAYYFGASIPFYAALGSFDQQNPANLAEITCTVCPQRSLPCGELIVKVQAKAIDTVIDANNSVISEVRKKMLAIYYEITTLLYIGSIDDIRKCMTKIAQEETIPCEGCQRSDWQAVGVNNNIK